MRIHGPDTDFQYVCPVTLTLEIWPWLKVMTHPWVMDNNYVKYYPDPTRQWGVMAWSQIFSMYALWPWHWRYDLRSRSWHNLGSWTISVLNIIPIQHSSEELWPRHTFLVCVHCDLDLGDMTLGQGHDTPLGHEQLREILSRSDKGVRSYFRCICIVTLTLEIWPWVKVMTQPWVMDNSCVKYYPDPTWKWGVMARTRIFGMCSLWPWPWRYYLGSRIWHTLWSWTTIVWNITRSNMAVRSYCPDTHFGHVFTVTLTLEIWHWVKVMTHPWSWTIVRNIIQIG